MSGVVALSPRTSFNSSPLVRELAALQVQGPATAATFAATTATTTAATNAPPAPLAERLGGWLGWTDAIALAAVLPAAGDDAVGHRLPRERAAARRAKLPAPGPGPGPAHLRAECQRVRDELALSIDTEAASATGPGPEAGDAADAPWATWRRRATTLQRTMDSRIAALRLRVRAALQRGPARLQALAALDAVLEEALRPRERHLLAGAAGLVERHARRSGDAGAAIAATWRRVMRAELDLRLQPVLGLLDALEEPAAAEAEPG